MTHPETRPCRPAATAVKAAVVAAAAVLVLLVPAAVALADGGGNGAVTQDLVEVVERIRTVIVSLLAALATLLLTVGGLRWLLAGGDPGEIDRARRSLTGAALGYGIAILATALLDILQYIVGDALTGG